MDKMDQVVDCEWNKLQEARKNIMSEEDDVYHGFSSFIKTKDMLRDLLEKFVTDVTRNHTTDITMSALHDHLCKIMHEYICAFSGYRYNRKITRHEKIRKQRINSFYLFREHYGKYWDPIVDTFDWTS